MDDQGNNLDSYTISLESFGSFRGPLFPKPVTGQELFSAASYSKPAQDIPALDFLLIRLRNPEFLKEISGFVNQIWAVKNLEFGIYTSCIHSPWF